MEASPVGISTAGTSDHGPLATSASGAVIEDDVEPAHPIQRRNHEVASRMEPVKAIGTNDRRGFAPPAPSPSADRHLPHAPSLQQRGKPLTLVALKHQRVVLDHTTTAQ